jgi:hypothetical protein
MQKTQPGLLQLPLRPPRLLLPLRLHQEQQQRWLLPLVPPVPLPLRLHQELLLHLRQGPHQKKARSLKLRRREVRTSLRVRPVAQQMPPVPIVC